MKCYNGRSPKQRFNLFFTLIVIAVRCTEMHYPFLHHSKQDALVYSPLEHACLEGCLYDVVIITYWLVLTTVGFFKRIRLENLFIFCVAWAQWGSKLLWCVCVRFDFLFLNICGNSNEIPVSVKEWEVCVISVQPLEAKLCWMDLIYLFFLLSLLSLYILLLLYLSSCVCYCFYCDCYFCFSLYVPVHLLVTIKFHSPNVWTISFFPNTLLPSIVSHLLTIRDKSYISSNSLLLHYPVKIA